MQIFTHSCVNVILQKICNSAAKQPNPSPLARLPHDQVGLVDAVVDALGPGPGAGPAETTHKVGSNSTSATSTCTLTPSPTIVLPIGS